MKEERSGTTFAADETCFITSGVVSRKVKVACGLVFSSVKKLHFPEKNTKKFLGMCAACIVGMLL